MVYASALSFLGGKVCAIQEPSTIIIIVVVVIIIFIIKATKRQRTKGDVLLSRAAALVCKETRRLSQCQTGQRL